MLLQAGRAGSRQEAGAVVRKGSRRRNALAEVVNLAQDQIGIRIRVEERSYVRSCSH